MKRKTHNTQMIKYLLITVILIISITGCQSKGLVSYQNALETTTNIEKGEVETEIELSLEFDKTGLSFEEEKKLSDLEELSGTLTSKFDMTKELMETNVYLIQGGMGLDFSLFAIEEELILQLPIINLFMILNDELMVTMSEAEEAEEITSNSMDITIDIDKVINDWVSVFKEENVVVGNNTYVLTNEGQLKTTKYTFNLDQEQLSRLQELLLSEVDTEELNDFIVLQMAGFSNNDDIDFNIQELLDKIVLNSIEGEAFVDFDDRLIHQNFTLKGEGLDVVPGDLESFEIKLSVTYSNLGDEQEFDFPTLTDENVVNQDELNEIFNTFGN